MACAIDYRLVQEDPDPGSTHVIGSPGSVPMSRVNRVREMLGLPPTTPEFVWAAIEAATDDMACAFRYVQSKAREWNIDPRRIVVGGFSAGARIALAAAFGEPIQPAGVVSLSGYMAQDDLLRLVRPQANGAPVLLVHGEHDLDYIVRQTPSMAQRFLEWVPGSEAWQVAQASHFYPCTSVATGPQGQRARVGEVVQAFLDKVASGRPHA